MRLNASRLSFLNRGMMLFSGVSLSESRILIKKPFRITRNGVFQPKLNACLGRKGFTAATTLAGIGIGHFEAAAGEAVAEIDHGTAQVICAEGIDQH